MNSILLTYTRSVVKKSKTFGITIGFQYVVEA